MTKRLGVGLGLLILIAIFAIVAKFNRLFLEGISTLIFGGILNLIVMAANKRRMPAKTIPGFTSSEHVIIDAKTKLKVLADIIPFPSKIGYFSIGDLVCFAGICMLALRLAVDLHELYVR